MLFNPSSIFNFRKVQIKKLSLIFLVFFALQIKAQNVSLVDGQSFVCFSCNQLKVNSKLENALKRLHQVRVNNLKIVQSDFPNQSDNLVSTSTVKSKQNSIDTLFTIMQIGDSHIQGDYFSGEVRIQLQSRFGNAGRGLLFPYALAKSYGPKGVSVKQLGHWNGLKTMSGSIADPLGVSGYAAYTKYPFSAFKISLTEKFREENLLGIFSIPEFQKIKIWHSDDNQSFKLELNSEFEQVDTFSSHTVGGWGITSLVSNVPQNEFTLSLQKSDSNQDHFGFYGFELVPKINRGVVYHHCGVVGAQFPHLINKAAQALEQIAYLKPDILVFSFGTNEAYNGKLDTSVYSQTILKFLDEISQVSPTTAIILTTPPDTRSRNRIPPHQMNVINQFYKIAKERDVIVYDLNAAMGGWGSLHYWYKNNLTISDKLHFNTAGYTLQGQLFTLSILEAYNRVNYQDTLSLYGLKSHIQSTLNGFTGNGHNQLDSESLNSDSSSMNVNTIQRTVVANEEQRSIIHTVKRGETVYSIGRKYKISPARILKVNRLKKSKKIKTGQRLIIPQN